MLDLTASNPAEAFANYPHEAIARAYCSSADFTYRPHPAGEPSARSAVVEYYATRGISLYPEQLVLTASTSEAYSFLFKLLCDADDEILVPVPSYPLFEYLAALDSVRVAPYRLHYDGSWFIDFDTLRASISPRSRAIIVVNPNNPTGSFLKQHEARQIFSLAQEHDLAIISDEVFLDYSFGEHPGRLRTLIGVNPVLTFSLGGLSKSAGMPQMKLAWIAITGPASNAEQARRHLELIADTYLSVSTPVQRALPELLRVGIEFHQQIAARIAANLETARASLANTSAHVLHVEGGWSAIIQLPSIRSEECWAELLLARHNIILQPGYFFDIASGSHAVVSLITPPETFALGIEKLRKTLDH